MPTLRKSTKFLRSSPKRSEASVAAFSRIVQADLDRQKSVVMNQSVGNFLCKGDVTGSDIDVSLTRAGIILITQTEGQEGLEEIIVFSADYIPVLKALLDKAAREAKRTRDGDTSDMHGD